MSWEQTARITIEDSSVRGIGGGGLVMPYVSQHSMQTCYAKNTDNIEEYRLSRHRRIAKCNKHSTRCFFIVYNVGVIMSRH